jgi:hypothetical protein
MTRRWLPISIAVVTVASLGVSLTSCNEPSCGPGTVQQQQKDGSLKCIPVDIQSTDIPCDVDAGMVKIVGGLCVPAVTCDPTSTMTQNGICYGSGNSTGCRTPASGKSCIDGTIYNFTTNTKNSTPIDALLFSATDLSAANPVPIAVGTVSADGSTYVFQDFSPPSMGLVVIITGKMTTATMVPAGTGGQNITNNSVFHIDAYALKQADVAGWGFDITTGGAQIARYFNDPAPASPTMVLNNETHPQSGVTMTVTPSQASAPQYFNDTLTAVEPSLTMTGALGTAIISAPVPTGSLNFPDFSGTGGGVTTWETFPGGSEAGLVLITRFHPTM